MVSPYLERRLRSYREALREIRKRHAVRRRPRAKDKGQNPGSGHLRLVPSDSSPRRADRPGKDA